jgi:hypothetical protein
VTHGGSRPESSPGQIRLERVLFVAIVLVGALDAWFYRQWNANPDGVSYIDVARAFNARGIGELINGYWSPLYPALIGLALKGFRPDPDWLYPTVRLVGFVVYVLTAFAYQRLLHTMLARRAVAPGEPRWVAPAITGSAWAIFFLLVTQATGLHLVTPDIGVAGVVFFVAAELISLTDERWSLGRWLRLGVVLAVGYWWKAILLPVGAIALATSAWIAWRRNHSRTGVALSGVTFIALSLLLIVPVSRHAGRPTFGETGRVNQLWYVNNVTMIPFRCVSPEGRLAREELGVVKRDSLLLTAPLTCATSGRVPEATLPMWFEPSAYYANVEYRLNAREVLVSVRNDVRYIVESLAEWAPATSVAIAVLLIGALVLRAMPIGGVPLLAFLVLPVAAYLIVYVELRHVVPFLIGIALAALMAVAGRGSRAARALVAVVALAAGLETARRLATQQRVEAAITVNRLRGTDRTEQLSVIAARELAARGLVAGDSVATVNALWNVEWAQRIGLVVRAYTPEYTYPVSNAFDDLRDPCRRASYLNTLHARGIKAVVLRATDTFEAPEAFTPLSTSGYRVMMVGAAETPATCETTRSSSGTAAR